MAKEKKQRKHVEIVKIIAIVMICCISAYIGVALIGQIGVEVNTAFARKVEPLANLSDLVPTLDEDTGYYTFHTDRDLKVLVLSDIHIGGGFMCMRKDRWALESVEKMIRGTSPDLVIATGDIAYPVPVQAGTADNMVSSKEFGTLMESLGVYWAVAFGNHDSESYAYYDREQIADYYQSLPHCLFSKGPEDVDGVGNYFINVKNSQGIITQAMFVLDSGSYSHGFLRGYDNIHQNQVDWYEREIKRLDGLNKEKGATQTISSIGFFHIPLTEVKDAYKEYLANGMKDTANVRYVYGIIGEPESVDVASVGVGDDNFFEKMVELRSTKAVFYGHDHLNNLSISYNGGSGDYFVDMVFVMSIDFLAYIGIKNTWDQRGGTVITLSPDSSVDYHMVPIKTLE